MAHTKKKKKKKASKMISGNSDFRIGRYRSHRVSLTDLVHGCKGGVLGQH